MSSAALRRPRQRCSGAPARRQHKVEPKYYADGENGLELHHALTREEVGLPPDPEDDLSSLGPVPHAAAANGRPLPGVSSSAGAAAADAAATPPPPPAAPGTAPPAADAAPSEASSGAAT